MTLKRELKPVSNQDQPHLLIQEVHQDQTAQLRNANSIRNSSNWLIRPHLDSERHLQKDIMLKILERAEDQQFATYHLFHALTKNHK